jgi:hypothetical protein
LPCGETVCAEHETMFRDLFTSECSVCNKIHHLTKNQHFPPSKMAQSFLDAELSKLYLGEEHKNSSELLVKLNEMIKNYEDTKNSAGNQIFERFRSMRQKVQLIRQEIIQKVIKCSERIISDINSYERKCRASLAELKSNFETEEGLDLSRIKNDLAKWEKRMEKLFHDQDLCKEINQKGNEYSESLQNGLKNLKNGIFLGQEKKFEFETKYLNIFDVFCKQVGFNT